MWVPSLANRAAARIRISRTSYPRRVLCAAMKVGIPKEIYPHEARVAATPETVQKIIKL